jgi:phospholipid/cholesterol/gamma-HCH transport system permease protein
MAISMSTGPQKQLPWLLYHEASKTLTFGGDWISENLPLLSKYIRDLKIFSAEDTLQIDWEQVQRVDLNGASMIWKVLEHTCPKKSQSPDFFLQLIRKGTHPDINRLLKFLAPYKELEKKEAKQLRAPRPLWRRLIEGVGRATCEVLDTSLKMLSFLGETTIALGRFLRTPSKIPWNSLSTFVQRSGFNALPIVGLISFLIGVVIIYQSVFQLRRFDAEIFAVDMLAISVLRELGVLITAVVLAGRSGSAFAAQIGTMSLNREVDALTTMGINPIEALALPRMIALTFSLPFLALFSDICGLAGGAMMSYFLMDLPLEEFIHHLRQGITTWTFWVGIIKAPFFAWIIGFAGCFEGFQVKKDAESVGIHTTKSVVEAIFMVIVMNAAFSVLFAELGI